jgi:hypothetical protein
VPVSLTELLLRRAYGFFCGSTARNRVVALPRPGPAARRTPEITL